MEKGNVLVIGNSGVGKSTLINAVLGDEKAETGYGTSGTTEKLEIYENNEIPFRIIDTVGFVPSAVKQRRAIHAVKKWSKESAKKGNKDSKIDVIWFCIDGTARKLFPETIKALLRATAIWKNVPIIVVITKSFSEPERAENIAMVEEAFTDKKKAFDNLKGTIPVVASIYRLNDTAFAAPEGIAELINITNEYIPEGIKASEKDIYTFNLKRKRALGHGIVGVSTTAAVTIGAAPVPFADALILSPLEIGQVNALARLYGINKNEQSKQLFNSIVEVGTVSIAAKTAISALKTIPGINLGAGVINAIIAGAIVAAMGEGSIYVFEKIYTGEKSVVDIDWVKKVMEAKLSNQFIQNVVEVIEKMAKNADIKDMNKCVASLLVMLFAGKEQEK